MTALFSSTCVNSSDELNHYCNKQPKMTAGRKIKNAIIQSGYFDRFSLYKDWHVKTYRMRFRGKLYAVVVHSCIEYFFIIEN